MLQMGAHRRKLAVARYHELEQRRRFGAEVALCMTLILCAGRWRHDDDHDTATPIRDQEYWRTFASTTVAVT